MWFTIWYVEPVVDNIDTLNILLYLLDMDDPENQSCKEVRLTFARYCSDRQKNYFFTTSTYADTIRKKCTDVPGKMKNE